MRMQALIFLTVLATASVVDCRKRIIPDSLCLLTAAAGLISFSPAQLFGVLAALPLLIAALIQPECMGGGDIKLTAAAGFVLGFWRGIWGMALGLLLAVLYHCAAALFQKSLIMRHLQWHERPFLWAHFYPSALPHYFALEVNCYEKVSHHEKDRSHRRRRDPAPDGSRHSSAPAEAGPPGQIGSGIMPGFFNSI